jgi:hypothetical protein
MAREAIAAGEVFLSIPLAACFVAEIEEDNEENIACDDVDIDVLPGLAPEWARGLLPTVQIAISIVREHMAPESAWKPYIESLPSHDELEQLPRYWIQEDVDAVGDDSFAAQVCVVYYATGFAYEVRSCCLCSQVMCRSHSKLY